MKTVVKRTSRRDDGEHKPCGGSCRSVVPPRCGDVLKSSLKPTSLAPGKDLSCVLAHKDGTKHTITLKHTLNAEQIVWFKAGSALNVLRKKDKN